MILINGESKEHIGISDRGFQYGDGLFETIEIRNGQAVFLDRHLQRLKVGCEQLFIPFPDIEVLRAEVGALCRRSFDSSGSGCAVLKIIVTRGSGGRGYRQPDAIQPTRILSLHPYPEYPQIFSEQGIVTRICTTRLGLNPALAGIKHMNRLEQVMARAEWNDASIQEGIMLDMNDHVIEGTMTNLFYVKNNVIYTAALTHSGVAGIMRGIIMDISVNHGFMAVEHKFTKNQLLSADEMFVCNSIIGIWPIKQIEGMSFSTGPITKIIQAELAKLIADDILYTELKVKTDSDCLGDQQ